MQNKFTQPVSMQVTKEQYERDLREPLLAMGYKECFITSFSYTPILVNNYGNNNGVLSNTNEEAAKIDNRHFIPEYNPEYFLAVAAMSNVKYGIYGEWWYCTEDVKMSSDGRIEYNKGKLYMGLEDDRIINNSREEFHSITKGYRFKHFRKATLQELITYFTKQKQENIMKKEITTELIEELKNLIAPENEEKFNKLMGVERPMFKKEGFITGDKVILRNGETYLVIRDCNAGYYGAQVFVLIKCEVNDGFIHSESYNEKLLHNGGIPPFDIMKIYRWGDGAIVGDSFSESTRNYKLIWERESNGNKI